jgi:hypothetical protein
MSRLSNLSARALQAAAATRSSLRERLPALAQKVARPAVLQRHADGATRVSQILSLLFLGPVIVVSLVLIVVLNNLLSDIFGVSDYGEAQGGIIGWLVTAITAGAFLLASWTWFQFVRTAGFGFFNYDSQ